MRDLTTLHAEAMAVPAAGQRFTATREFLWFKDIADILRKRLGDRVERCSRATSHAEIAVGLTP